MNSFQRVESTICNEDVRAMLSLWQVRDREPPLSAVSRRREFVGPQVGRVLGIENGGMNLDNFLRAV